MTIEIGNKPLKQMSAEEVKQVIMIEGACPSLEFWKEPEIIGFDTTTFSDTHVLDHVSYRREDEIKGSQFCFFLNFEDFYFHYTKDYEITRYSSQPKRLGLKTLSYLIKQGYNIPLYGK